MLITTLLFSLSFGWSLERPVFTLAQGYVESNMNSNARGKSGERGAWQVIEKYWGKVPKKLHEQGRQAERITNELLAENGNSLYLATVRYNGSGRDAVQYVDKVRKKAIEFYLTRT